MNKKEGACGDSSLERKKKNIFPVDSYFPFPAPVHLGVRVEPAEGLGDSLEDCLGTRMDTHSGPTTLSSLLSQLLSIPVMSTGKNGFIWLHIVAHYQC